MRVTERVVFRQAIHDVSTIRSDLFQLQRQGATGKKFHAIEEDPTSAERLRLLKEAKEATSHYGNNITRSRTQLSAADSALEEASNIIIRAKELSLAGATETLAAEQRTILAQEVESLHESMVVAANTKAAGEFVFGGFLTNQEPFQTDGTYLGDDGQKAVDVGPNARLIVNASGANAFTAAGGMDIFAALESLRAALASDDLAGVRSATTAMDQALTQISTARTDIGLKLNRLDVANAVRDRLEDSLTFEESQFIDADPVAVFLDLNATTNALQGAVAVSQKVANTSILGV